MEDDNQSSEALQVKNSRTDDEEMEEDDAEEEFDDDDDDVDDDDDGDKRKQPSDLESTPAAIGKELRTSQIETLAVPSCYLRTEVPEEYTLQRHESAELKSKVRGSHQEALASVIAQAAQAQAQNQLQSPACPPSSSSELTPSSVTQPISSAVSPTAQEQRLAPVVNSNSLRVAVVDQQNASDPKSVSSSPVVRTHATDGYNWRKYGQKQVKSPQGSRSYYKCTCTQCYAKKIECCDHSNCVTEIIYKGQHNHDPPKKVNRARENKLALSVAPISMISNTGQPIQALMDTDPSTCSKVVIQDMPSIPEMKRQNSIDSDGDTHFKIKEEHTDDPEPKQRAKKTGSACSGSLLKTGKKPKLVVHAAGDMGISGDGYRWRKYGQKMVKGNPHPRNYYRCTSAGCPVRKHIERAVDSSTGVIITYKGVHDHDMPVPKKRHSTPSGLLVTAAAAAAASASMNKLQSTKAEPLSNQESMTQWSVNTEGGLTGEALKVQGEKAVDSARTLLSVGFEIKPC